MKASLATSTDPNSRVWAINDRVIQLRIWGTDVVYPLPTTSGDDASDDELILGTAATCSLRLDDPRVSRQHAALVRRTMGWAVRDLGSKNGLKLDGTKHVEGDLEPGTELTLGGVILIAESEQLIALRDFLARLLGWGEAQRPDVDRALRAVRMATTQRAPLVLSGPGELVLVARALHNRVHGREKPFILCDPRRGPSDGGVRSAANRDEADVALQAARGGSLCLIRQRLPARATEVFSAGRDPESNVQLIVCAPDREADEVESFLSAARIAMPSLAERADDVDRIIAEYAKEATAEFGGVLYSFTDEDLAWVRKFSASSLPDIEKGTRRLVAIRTSPNGSLAAYRLGMAPVSLARWVERRGPLGPSPLVAMQLASRRVGPRPRKLASRRVGPRPRRRRDVQAAQA